MTEASIFPSQDGDAGWVIVIGLAVFSLFSFIQHGCVVKRWKTRTFLDAFYDCRTILGGGAGDLMEYLVLRNLPDQARAILERARALGVTEEVLNEGAVLAAQGTKPAWKSRYAVGWTAAKLGLLD